MSELRDQVLAYNKEVKEALETVFNELNNGQQKKLLKSEKVKALFNRYKIKYEE
jgi:hypothetical protein